MTHLGDEQVCCLIYGASTLLRIGFGSKSTRTVLREEVSESASLMAMDTCYAKPNVGREMCIGKRSAPVRHPYLKHVRRSSLTSIAKPRKAHV